MSKIENEKVEKVVIGILAHVDAGKTTLSESMLYIKDEIRKLGRVDHQDTFLDNDSLEKERGITIFSKQAQMGLGNLEVTLLDTPGHVDFSAEMERTLQVLDYGILVVNGTDGVQGHTLTLWKLLEKYQIPVFLFVNKMDQTGMTKDDIMKQLMERLDDRCLEFPVMDEYGVEFLDSLALCDEDVMETYLSTGEIFKSDIQNLIWSRKVFPCYFGSALKLEGVEELLSGLEKYILPPSYGDAFSGRVFKITRDKQGNRLTHVKITGGSITVKDVLPDFMEENEKINQIRVYSGDKYQTPSTVDAGSICTFVGPMNTYAGQALGVEENGHSPVLEPVLNYQIIIPEGSDVHGTLKLLRQIEEEEPQLQIVWDEQLGEIHAKVMGEVEMEVLCHIVKERYGLEIAFGQGSIVYKETIQEAVVGVGHFEPLRHYAEVHLLLEPGKPGSGLVFDVNCNEEILGRSWQRLVVTHLQEKRHKGVLTGEEVTDIKVTLVAGRAHPKHTEGGDFRQATYRAFRQGLRKTNSVLLEPVYNFRLEIPIDSIGRALTDIQRMYGKSQAPIIKDDYAVIHGRAPVATMSDYQMEVIAYTRGLGKLFCSVQGYEPCHNADVIIEKAGYVPEEDLENPTGSVFCSQGAGFLVEWDKVEKYQHVESGFFAKKEVIRPEKVPVKAKTKDFYATEKELEEIFTRTYGEPKRNQTSYKKTISAPAKAEKPYKWNAPPQKDKYLLVDGYNIIHAWDDLKELAQINMDSARNKLIEVLSNYQGYHKNIIILVFDAYKVVGSRGSIETHQNIHVVYTKEAETADQYIEKTVHEMGLKKGSKTKADVTVATSDAMEQMIIWGDGAMRLSAMGLKEEIERTNQELREEYLKDDG